MFPEHAHKNLKKLSKEQICTLVTVAILVQKKCHLPSKVWGRLKCVILFVLKQLGEWMSDISFGVDKNGGSETWGIMWSQIGLFELVFNESKSAYVGIRARFKPTV